MSDESVLEEVELKVGQLTIRVSKAHLRSISPYFEAMFSQSFAEKDQKEIIISGPDPHTFKSIIEFTLGQPMDFTKPVAYEALKIADMFDLTAIRSHCEKYLNMNLDNANVVKIWILSDRHGLPELAQICQEYLLWKFDDIRDTVDWKHVPMDNFPDLMAHPGLNTPSEAHVVDIIHQRLAWCTPSELDKFLCHTLKAIRFQELTSGEVKAIQAWPFLTEEALELLSDVSALEQPDRAVPIKPGIIGLIGDSSNFLNIFSPAKESLTDLIYLPMIDRGLGFACGFRVCGIGSSLYVLGGERAIGQSNWNRKVWQYDTIFKRWESSMEIPLPMRHMGICAHQDRYILILGGYGKFRIESDMVVAIDTLTKSHEILTSLPQPNHGMGCCVFQDKLYVFGNPILAASLDTLPELVWETLNPQCHLEGIFESVEQLDQVKFASAVSAKSGIYLAVKYRSELCQFDPRTNEILVIGKFNAPSINIAVADEKVYSFGHTPSEGAVIETFDIENKHFEVIWADKDYRFLNSECNGSFSVVQYGN